MLEAIGDLGDESAGAIVLQRSCAQGQKMAPGHFER